MEAAAIDGAKLILNKLFEVASEEFKLVRGFEKELANLKTYLRMINEVLEDAEKRVITNNAVKRWLEVLEDAAYNADNVLDEIKYEDLRRTKETEDEIGCLNFPCIMTFLRKMAHKITFQWKMSHMIKGINENLKRINDEANILGLNRVPVAKPSIKESTSFAVDRIIIGRESDESEILETITSSVNNFLSVLPIVGMGGIGKTTLARKIFNHHRIETLFLRSSVPDGILPYFKHLHSLKLCDAVIEELPTSIGTLKHLRYLDVSDNDDLTTLPESICKLYNLQTLRILWRYSYGALERLPEDLRFLTRLKHLYITDVTNDFEMPPKIGSLSCLQTLTLFCVSDKEGCRIDELGKLKKLKGKLKILGLELVSSKTEAEHADMAGKPNIYKLYFYWSKSTNSIESNVNDESVLEGLQPHKELKCLAIGGFRGKKFPLWTRNMRIYQGNSGPPVIFDKLIKIKIMSCGNCEEIPVLGHLPLLKYLHIVGLDNVTSIRSSFYGECDCTTNSSNDGQETRESFPSLKSLVITDMPNLINWEEAQMSGTQVFPCLEYLKLDECEKLVHVPHLRGSSASLKKMGISYCPELRKLHYDLGSLQSLEELTILRCEKLQSIVYQNGQEGLRSLQNLEIRYCHELCNLPNEMLKYCTSLRTLCVQECHNLTSLPEMSGMGSLQSLVVEDCRNLTSFPEMSGMKSLQKLRLMSCASFPKLMGCLNSLIELSIGLFPNSMELHSFQSFINGIECMKSLESVFLYGPGDWVSQLDQPKHLSSLKELSILSFGMEALPEWIGNLSSLEKLNVTHCGKLEHLPSKEAMQRLTKLKQLAIRACPLLRCSAECDPPSEWPKISHIPHVYIQDW